MTNLPSSLEDVERRMSSYHRMADIAAEHNGHIVDWAPENGCAVLRFTRNTDARDFKEAKARVCFGERQIQVWM